MSPLPGRSPSEILLVVEQLRRRVPGGIGTYAASLAAALGRAACTEEGGASGPTPPTRVTLYASRGPGHPDPLGGYGLPLRRAELPGAILTRAWDAGVLAAPRGFDVVHGTSLAAPSVRGGARGALVVTVHDLLWRTVPEVYPRRGRRWHERRLHRVLEAAAGWVTPSAAVADELRAAGADPARVTVIEHGADHLPPPDNEAARRLLDRLGVGRDFLLTVGTLEPRKNLARLAAGYRLARPELPEPWPLVVVGPRGWDAGGQTLSGPDSGPETSAGPDGVVFTGPVDAAVLAALYDRARVVAYVPLAEGYGLPVTEAMARGAPVVASAVPAAAGAARIVDPFDPASIASGLVAVAGDQALAEELVASGRRRTAGLTWAAAARAHLQLWRTLS